MSQIIEETMKDWLLRNWFIRCVKKKTKYVAWGSLLPLTANDPLKEGDKTIWFQFGQSSDEAILALKKEISTLIFVR